MINAKQHQDYSQVEKLRQEVTKQREIKRIIKAE